ncbi:lipoyl(octanoyl) transferase LipB [Alkalibacter saccharofermentans]|uniref:Octanoyltransferase n=1 Tax=Alkalibacter saccharofermentans DSM 14828 TaxID=1120975 RepID=A0A1M4VHK5_9FIRM|nr:lipoyl(octanoyl) transferase LipB [Alkalibacter saccharofermentans]SHE68293.1 lipoyl(octanoyl) transferase [Alkalibacter saccharofermentans DSM 14828]
MEMNLLDLGLTEYGPCLELQKKIRELRENELIKDTLILTEHKPVITLGCRGNDEHILAGKELLESMGIGIHSSNRGGDVTYHGPGQIVGYPIINLKKANISAKDYLDNLLEIFIQLLKNEYNINAHKENKEYTGVWIGKEKITAIGIHVKHMVTMHGFAYNVSTNMEHFKLINPCGLTDRTPVSLEMLTGKKISMTDAKKQVVEYFKKVFDATFEDITLSEVEKHV